MDDKTKARLPEWMPEEQVPAFVTAYEAVEMLAAARQEPAFDTLWWLFAAPFKVTKASYQDFYGTKEAWSVVIEHPAHKNRKADR